MCIYVNSFKVPVIQFLRTFTLLSKFYTNRSKLFACLNFVSVRREPRILCVPLLAVPRSCALPEGHSARKKMHGNYLLLQSTVGRALSTFTPSHQRCVRCVGLLDTGCCAVHLLVLSTHVTCVPLFAVPRSCALPEGHSARKNMHGNTHLTHLWREGCEGAPESLCYLQFVTVLRTQQAGAKRCTCLEHSKQGLLRSYAS